MGQAKTRGTYEERKAREEYSKLINSTLRKNKSTPLTLTPKQKELLHGLRYDENKQSFIKTLAAINAALKRFPK